MARCPYLLAATEEGLIDFSTGKVNLDKITSKVHFAPSGLKKAGYINNIFII
ncbi:hypothetical protein J4731_25740 [Providencia rettgeri]|nr:hypothetical protein [Providencia rettgeri]